MAETYKVLGQSNPSAATLTDAYTVPGATSAVISSVIITNRSATPTAFRMSVAVGGAADNNKQYIAYDIAIGANETKDYTIGATMAASDVLRVYATLSTLSFNIFGLEKT